MPVKLFFFNKKRITSSFLLSLFINKLKHRTHENLFIDIGGFGYGLDDGN